MAFSSQPCSHYQRVKPQVGRLGDKLGTVPLHGSDDGLGRLFSHLLQNAVITPGQQFGHITACGIPPTAGFEGVGQAFEDNRRCRQLDEG